MGGKGYNDEDLSGQEMDGDWPIPEYDSSNNSVITKNVLKECAKRLKDKEIAKFHSAYHEKYSYIVRFVKTKYVSIDSYKNDKIYMTYKQ